VFDQAVRDPAGAFDLRGCDRILDIGCGNRPFAQATHLVDVSLTDHSERFGYPIPLDGRPFYECSVEELPFDDGSFDYAYCSHVLEHVERPDLACRELMRVAKRGYIETPRSWVEYVFGAASHRWLIDDELGVLIFREKLAAEDSDPLGIRDAIFSLMDNPRFRAHWNSAGIRAVRNVEWHWDGSFDFAVIRAEERLPRRGELGNGARPRDTENVLQHRWAT